MVYQIESLRKIADWVINNVHGTPFKKAAMRIKGHHIVILALQTIELIVLNEEE